MIASAPVGGNFRSWRSRLWGLFMRSTFRSSFRSNFRFLQAIEHQNSHNPGGTGTDCKGADGPAALHAFDATNLGSPTPLYSSANVQTTIGDFTKFVPPTIFSGQVYMATQTEVDVFGLCSTNVNNGGACLP
jgi:hypothetical protein